MLKLEKLDNTFLATGKTVLTELEPDRVYDSWLFALLLDLRECWLCGMVGKDPSLQSHYAVSIMIFARSVQYKNDCPQSTSLAPFIIIFSTT